MNHTFSMAKCWSQQEQFAANNVDWQKLIERELDKLDRGEYVDWQKLMYV